MPKRRFDNSHVHPKLRGQVYDLLNGIAVSLEQHLAIPALMLIYAGVDGMAFVSLPEDRLEVQPQDFENWATTYLLPDSGLPCSAADLYAARCGLVHSQNVDSRLVRQGHARHLWYHLRGPLFLVPFNGGHHAQPMVLDLHDFAGRFQIATERFFQAIETDEALEHRVWHKAERYFDEVIAHGDLMKEGSWIETNPPYFGFEDDDTLGR